ncbi:Uncharacterised protein [Chryseobacterium taklimakanense]|uniref:DUF5681 domain-containing protein n=1 Tax=Chryseobacterium taklimakanense TaxID=536441 RepID=A0A239XMJ7_9FLAO|nr:hypothetical protein [Chryseobacterium taklimakanense]SNV48181.1 Uncharacterised protein [Chryseobacterium taklimakanense]
MSRNKDGTFAPGNPGGGRPKGSKNKQTENIRQFFIDFVDRNKEELQNDFEILEPKERFKYIFDMAKFFLPTLKAVEFGNILDELTEDDFEKLLNQIKEQYNLN